MKTTDLCEEQVKQIMRANQVLTGIVAGLIYAMAAALLIFSLLALAVHENGCFLALLAMAAGSVCAAHMVHNR